MTRRIKRTKDLEVTLVINNDDFIKPPQQAQRNVLLNKALHEFMLDLGALDKLAEKFVPGHIQHDMSDRTQTDLSDEEIMEDWQIPVMQSMATLVGESKGHILEIGFGRGVASDMIQAEEVAAHTIIECNDSVIRRYEQWKEGYPGRDIRIVHGLWQDTIGDLGQFDGIFFHTYPLNEDEYMEYVSGSVTFAQHFFSTAAQHLHKGGVFTYLTNEIDSLSRAHQRALFEHFSSFSLQIIPLKMPQDVKDTWWADKMAVVKAVK
ncbi:MAG: class I SAM-dependent methyltransferase [Bacteroidota bacterium]